MGLILKVNVDGASAGNPGPSGIGVVLRDSKGRELKRISKFTGVRTNNEAEYLAVIEGLKLCKKMGADEVFVYTDSELVTLHFSGAYRVKSPRLRPLFEKIRLLMQNFKRVHISHIPREENRIADALAKRAARVK